MTWFVCEVPLGHYLHLSGLTRYK